MLPAIFDKVVSRPGGTGHFIPDGDYEEFWTAFYERLRKKVSFQKPISAEKLEDTINPFFGYFGFRFHPVKLEPHYFHLGLDISGRARTSVRPLLDGILEYSGFGHINGNYVFLSHPDVVTEDGFKLHSLYMHLKTINVKFSSYQKMLRQISFNHYPNVEIKKETIIGGMGSTGISEGTHVHLHLQLEFRNDKGVIVVINPAEIFELKSPENLSAGVKNLTAFKKFLSENQEEIKKTHKIRLK